MLEIVINESNKGTDGIVNCGQVGFNPEDNTFFTEASCIDGNPRSMPLNVSIYNAITKVRKIFTRTTVDVNDNELTAWRFAAGNLKLVVFND